MWHNSVSHPYTCIEALSLSRVRSDMFLVCQTWRWVKSVSEFAKDIVLNFFVAFGVLIGGALLGGLGAFFVGQPPMYWMYELAKKLKIWALVAAIGGTMDTLSVIERGFFSGEPGTVVKQLVLIGFALLGAHSGTTLIQWLVEGE